MAPLKARNNYDDVGLQLREGYEEGYCIRSSWNND